MRHAFFVFICFFCALRSDAQSFHCETDTNAFIDPTGIYNLGALPEPNPDEPTGNTGEIRIQYLGNNRIVICLLYNGVAPGYNIAYFQDTLIYDDNWAEWRCGFADTSCVIRFAFSTKGINVRMFSNDPDFACGFGHNAHCDGFYRKTSDARPAFGDWCVDP